VIGWYILLLSKPKRAFERLSLVNLLVERRHYKNAYLIQKSNMLRKQAVVLEQILNHLKYCKCCVTQGLSLVFSIRSSKSRSSKSRWNSRYLCLLLQLGMTQLELPFKM
jgi:hypothetical protein